MSVFWRSAKHRWYLAYDDASGVQRQHVIPPESAPNGKSRKAALEYEAGWLKDQKARGALPAVKRTGGATVAEVAVKWLKQRKTAILDGQPEFAPATIAANELHLRTRILPAFGPRSVSELTTDELRKWVRELSADVSSSYCNNVHSTFRTMVDDARGERWIALPGNPLADPHVLNVLPEVKRAAGKRPLFVELDHTQRLVACPDVPDHRRVRYLVDFTSGLSEGELAARTWEQVQIEERPVYHVTDALPTVGAEGWATIGPTKNEHRVRTLPMHETAAEALRWWKKEGWCDYVGRPPKSSDPIFPGPSGSFSRPASAALIRKDLRAAGCPDTCWGFPITAQAIRRSFATYLDAAGVTEEVRGRLLGHAAKSVTAKHYTAAAVETDRAAVNLIALVWSPPSVAAPASLPVHVPGDVPRHVDRETSASFLGATSGTRTPDLRFTNSSARAGTYPPSARKAYQNQLERGPANDGDAPNDGDAVPQELVLCAGGLALLRASDAGFDAFFLAGVDPTDPPVEESRASSPASGGSR